MVQKGNMQTFDRAEIINKSGLENVRDFQIGLEQAWHNQTKVVTEILKTHFPEIIGFPTYFEYGEAKTKTGNYIPVSLDDSLPIGNEYNPQTYTLFTPREAWEYAHELLSGTGFVTESVGMIRERTRWFLSIRLKELDEITLAGHKSFLNLSGGLDQSFSPSFELFDERIVCRNSLSRSRAQGKVLFKRKATKNFRLSLSERQSEIEKAVGMTAIFNAALKAMSEKPASVDQARQVYTGFIVPDGTKEISTRSRNMAESLTGLFQRGLGNRGETREDILNGFTQARTRGFDDSKKSVWSTFESSESGLFADEKARFFNVLSNDDQFETIRERGQSLLVLTK